ncbi:hypothetical protein GWK08_16415 [Leptobacterium flavescens]|uniref:SnoaL-like domain-containing protein n=1 Tax=Leptobacterium flavescens TaxID=472055 RepID=A0A6P0UNT5_9FLAO|nr:nuclear transport factor 2 family protein [Leptobacterium flavescens]NER15041.1 hypothetical protein [Leptobacterium flavescens]
MELRELVKRWFKAWEEGDFYNLPITENFSHTSPYGTIDGKKAYTDLVAVNRDKFLGHRFELHDEIYDEDRACVRYTAVQGDFKLEVSEWYFPKDGLIEQIVAYYNIEGEISDERKLKDLND